MKSRFTKILFTLALLLGCGLLDGCSNAHWGSSMGVNMQFGPAGPRITPSFNVGVYSGGRW